MSGPLVLGIETSCDETGAGLVRGHELLADAIASSVAEHARFGGVVPEVASRAHLEAMVPAVDRALATAGVRLGQVDAIAVTAGPGLAGALQVGVCAAKAYALALGKPLYAVNHLAAHIAVDQLEHGPLPRPVVALLVSGGHSSLLLVPDVAAEVLPLGATIDDAAGEAYDKVAKLLGLGYPGGPWIDALAPLGNPRAIPFTFAEIKPRIHRDGSVPVNKKAPPRSQGPHFDFSFSGIKTAVLRYVETHHLRASIEARRAALAADPSVTPKSPAVTELCDQQALDLIASFQYAVVGNLQRQTFAAAESLGARGIVVSGGVAANSELRRRFQAEADRRGLPIAFPSLALSTDNAAMIAAAAWPKLLAHEFASEDLGATPQLRLGQQ